MTTIGRISGRLLLAMGLAIVAGPAAVAMPAALAGTLGRLERDIGGAIGLVQILREQVATAELAEAGAASAAGIADGGYVSTLRALRVASRRLERRIDELRQRLPDLDDPEAGDILLAMRLELASLELAFDDVLVEPGAAGRQDALARMDEALLSLDGATAAVWTVDSVRAAGDDGDRYYWAAHDGELSPHPPLPPGPYR